MLTRASLVVALSCASIGASSLACSDDGEGGTAEASEETGSDTGSAPGEGQPAQGWESAYVDGAVVFSCDDDEATLASSGAPGLSFGDTSIYVGFEQDKDNQNPLFVRFDAGTQTYCERHETEGPDGRAEGLTWDGGDVAYVVYTIVGGGTALEGKGGWLASYGPGPISGGGPKVSVLGRVTTSTGLLDTASFIIAVDSDNRVNSHSPRAAPTVLEDGTVEFLGESAHKPIDADGMVSMDCTDYPFDSRYVLAADLGTLICASCSNCNSQQPCE